MSYNNHSIDNSVNPCPRRARMAFIDRVFSTGDFEEPAWIELPTEPVMENGEWISEKACRLDQVLSIWLQLLAPLSPNVAFLEFPSPRDRYILNSQFSLLNSSSSRPSP